MFASLRSRLLTWYTAILAIVILGFGSAVCYLAWRDRLADVDARLAARAAMLAGGLRPVPGGTFDLTLPPDPVAAAPGGEPELYHVLWTPEGRPIDRSDPERDVPMPVAMGGRSRDGSREVAVRAAAGAIVLAGHDLSGLRADIWSLAGTLAAVGALSLALALAGGWLLVGRALAPIARISGTARRMIGGDFRARIPIDRVETELGQVAGALNEAFDRLSLSLERQRRFTADASHELRTPLATISTETEWALSRDREAAGYRESLESCRRAALRMRGIVERLLMLARDESVPEAADRRDPVRLDAIVEEVVRDARPSAAHRNVDLTLDAPAPVVVTGDADRLRDAITNVIANAIQYNAQGGHVRVVLSRAPAGRAVLCVTDTGIGIQRDALPRVFEPFFRADPARSRAAGGAGLGLAVAKAAVERHGGRITLASAEGRGTEVAIELPAGPPE